MTETDMKVKMVDVTPRMAEKMLERNTHNRQVRVSAVEQYSRDMRNGDWQLNGEAIKIAVDGTILDGQHRLFAVLEADVPVRMLVITGLPAEAQETMDQGRSRSFADVLKLRGEKNPNELGAAVRMVCLYERDGIPFLAGYGSAPPSVKEQSRTLDRNPEIRESVHMAVGKRRAWITASSVAGFHYLFATADQADANMFFEKLLTGVDLAAGDPILVLRERLIREHHEGYINSKIKLAFVVRAWNAWRTGEPLKRLVFSPGGSSPDRFPQIDGLAYREVNDDLEQAA